MATPTSQSSASPDQPAALPDGGRVVSKESLTGTVGRTPEGGPVACVEKIKVLNENLAELRDMAQDAVEDAVLMGCDGGPFRRAVQSLLDGLINPYTKPCACL